MIDERYAGMVQELGLVPGSSWVSSDRSYVLMVLEDTDEEFDEPRAWCRVLKIPATGCAPEHATLFYPYLCGLVDTGQLVRVE